MLDALKNFFGEFSDLKFCKLLVACLQNFFRFCNLNSISLRFPTCFPYSLLRSNYPSNIETSPTDIRSKKFRFLKVSKFSLITSWILQSILSLSFTNYVLNSFDKIDHRFWKWTNAFHPSLDSLKFWFWCWDELTWICFVK